MFAWLRPLLILGLLCASLLDATMVQFREGWMSCDIGVSIVLKGGLFEVGDGVG